MRACDLLYIYGHYMLVLDDVLGKTKMWRKSPTRKLEELDVQFYSKFNCSFHNSNYAFYFVLLKSLYCGFVRWEESVA